MKLASTVAQRAPEEALVILTRALESDPDPRGGRARADVVLARTGRRSEALARYERLVDELLDAFGTDPDTQTMATVSRVVDRLAGPRSASTSPPA